MKSFTREYFNNYCYFLIEGNGEDFTLEYAVNNSLNETKTEKKKFKKENLKNIQGKIQKVLKQNKEVTKKELDELIDDDGTMLSSKIPNLSIKVLKTLDQRMRSAHGADKSMSRGITRVFYGESVDEDNDVINEINFEDAFGYEETKDKDYVGTIKTLKKMGVDDPQERVKRAKQFGKLKKQKVKKTKSGKKVLKQRLVEKEKLDEIRKDKMIKMVEDIITNKKGDNEIMDKDEKPLSKLIEKNLESIKNLAKKEGISLNKLINILRKGE